MGYIPVPDWSRDIAYVGEPNHGLSKFLGGQGLLVLITVGITSLGAAQAAELQPYGGPGGGHHIPAQSAFRGAAGYNATEALAIPNAELARLGVSHATVTGAQQTLYRAFAQTGQVLTWEAIETIETQALIRGGMNSDTALATVRQAIQALKDAGVSGPTRIPWGG